MQQKILLCEWWLHEFWCVPCAVLCLVYIKVKIKFLVSDCFIPDSSRAVSKPVRRIPLLCVQWKSPDDGQRNCPKFVEFYSKNKFEKLVHLVGFILRISPSCLQCYLEYANFMFAVRCTPFDIFSLLFHSYRMWVVMWEGLKGSETYQWCYQDHLHLHLPVAEVSSVLFLYVVVEGCVQCYLNFHREERTSCVNCWWNWYTYVSSLSFWLVSVLRDAHRLRN